MAKLRSTIYYEFFTVDNLNVPKATGTRTLSDVVIKTGIDSVPTLTMTIPLEDLPTDELDKAGSGQYYEPHMQRYVIVVHIHSEGIEKYVFRGVVDKMDINYSRYNVSLSLSHEVARMREWSMPLNYTIKNMPLDFAISAGGAALGFSNPIEGETMQTYNSQVNFEYRGFTEMPRLYMTFGSNNKLEALSEVLRNTESAHFWVMLHNYNVPTIVIENFVSPLDQSSVSGELTFSPYKFDEDECYEPTDQSHVTMLTEPTFNVDYTDHFNRAVVLCGDIQDGVHHLTLEPIYSNSALQITGFPVKMYTYSNNLQPEPEYDENGRKINNEKIYRDSEVIAYIKNTNREYYIEDSKQLAADENIILGTTFNFNELYPIPSLKEDIDNDGTAEEPVITDEDRTAIAMQAYLRAIRKLKAQRPQRLYQFNSTALPVGTHPGTISRLSYSKTVNQENEECDSYDLKRKVLNINENMYLTEMTITFDDGMNEIATVSLDTEIRIHDISPVEIELEEEAGTAQIPDRVSLGSTFGPYRHRDNVLRDETDNAQRLDRTLNVID